MNEELMERYLTEGQDLVKNIENALKNLVIAKAEYELNQNTTTVEQDKWQRVIDEGYLCKFWDDNMYSPEYRQYGTLIEVHTDSRRPSFISFRHNGDSTYDNCEVLREEGIKQPYFQGDDTPEIIGEVVVYYGNTNTEFHWGVGDIDWSEVVAYIEV